jgi:hypothetical protein
MLETVAAHSGALGGVPELLAFAAHLTHVAFLFGAFFTRSTSGGKLACYFGGTGFSDVRVRVLLVAS